MRKELPAIQKAYDLAKELLPRVSKFPRDYKFTLGDRIVGNVLEVLELLLQASFSRKRAEFLAAADLHLERLRFLLRLACELGSLSHNGYEHIMVMVTELGKQIGGWRKQTGNADAQDL